MKYLRVGHSGLVAGGRKEFTRLGRRTRRSSCGLGVGEAERREGCEGGGRVELWCDRWWPCRCWGGVGVGGEKLTRVGWLEEI